ncbi:hypothetical protein B0H10DRAFT_2206797 [Mycena sp. CBHHK59/15]|nr:hypothetical protein B0H10DRAFT_2206797 [Mycena sp. CBHHK59/15]
MLVAGSSSRPARGVKRERSESLQKAGRKRARAVLTEEKQDIDELDGDVDDNPIPAGLHLAVASSISSNAAGEQSQRADQSSDLSPHQVARTSSPIAVRSSPAPSSPKLVNLDAIHSKTDPGPQTSLHSPASPAASLSSSAVASSSREPMVVNSPAQFTVASSSKLLRSLPSPSPSPPPRVEPEPLSAYSCPICFFPPTNATLTPCGHVCCGSCLFTAVKTMTQRGAMMPEASVARCPVCRAQIPDWDGKGGGVIGLKVRAVFSL